MKTAAGLFEEDCGVGKSYEFDEEMIDVVDKTVVYIGMFNLIWGHCITDNQKHLWVMLHSEYSSRNVLSLLRKIKKVITRYI